MHYISQPVIPKLLHDLLLNARHGDFSVSVTLNVNGTLVSGWLCSPVEYYRGMKARLTAPGEPAEPGSFLPWLDKEIEETEQQLRAESELGQQMPIQYIYLRDAVFFQGPIQIPSGDGVWWAGKLAAVDGWTLGKLSPKDPAET